jgi:hypothetical protein
MVLGDDIVGPIYDLPPAISVLSIGNSFSEKLPPLPESLRILTVGNAFNHPLGKLPENLEQLALGDSYNQDFEAVPEGIIRKNHTLPRYILKLGIHFNKSLSPLFPQSVKENTAFLYPMQIFVTNPFFQYAASVPRYEELFKNVSYYDFRSRYPLLHIKEIEIHPKTDTHRETRALAITAESDIPWHTLGQLLALEYPELTGGDVGRNVNRMDYIVLILKKGLKDRNALDVILEIPFFKKIAYIIIGTEIHIPESINQTQTRYILIKKNLDKGQDIRVPSLNYKIQVIFFEECSICYSGTPSFLSCPRLKEQLGQRAQHYICSNCLTKYEKSQTQSGVTCPICRREIGVPGEEGKAFFQPLYLPESIMKLLKDDDDGM